MHLKVGSSEGHAYAFCGQEQVAILATVNGGRALLVPLLAKERLGLPHTAIGEQI